MKIPWCVSILVCLTALCAPFSQAVIIDGVFAGHAFYATDGHDQNKQWIDYWSEDVIGQAINGTFWYDTALAPKNSTTHPNEALHNQEGPTAPIWLGITLNVDGKHIDVLQHQQLKPDAMLQLISLYDYEFPANPSNDDLVQITKEIYASDDEGNHDYNWFSVIISEFYFEFLSSANIEQEFSWTKTPNTWGGSGFFATNGVIGDQQFQANLGFTVDSLSTEFRHPVSIGEPAPYALLGFGVLLLLMNFCKSEK